MRLQPAVVGLSIRLLVATALVMLALVTSARAEPAQGSPDDLPLLPAPASVVVREGTLAIDEPSLMAPHPAHGVSIAIVRGIAALVEQVAPRR